MDLERNRTLHFIIRILMGLKIIVEDDAKDINSRKKNFSRTPSRTCPAKNVSLDI